MGLFARNIFPVHGSTDNGKICFKMKEKLVPKNCRNKFFKFVFVEVQRLF